MLLLVKKRFADAIRAGTKTLEIRAGARYRNVRAGDTLSINGHFRAVVTAVEHHTRETLYCALPEWRNAVESCYPNIAGPFYVFHLYLSGNAQSKQPSLFD